MIYTVTFNPAIDYVMNVPGLVPGEVNRSESESVFFGGKGINVSFVLRQLGKESTALGFIAGFTGDAIRRGVEESGITSDFIRLENGLSRINVKVKAGRETDLNGKGPDIPANAVAELFTKLDKLEKGDVLILAGSIPPDLPEDIYEKILASLSGKDVLCVVDATGDLLKNVLVYKPFLIKPNHHELGEIFGKTLTTTDEIAFYAKEMQKMGARNVLVSRAGDGALLADETGRVHIIGTAKGSVVNSVGAGDSMVAGFLAGWFEKHDYAYALALGSAAGSATAFSEGLAEKALIYQLLEEIQSEELHETQQSKKG